MTFEAFWAAHADAIYRRAVRCWPAPRYRDLLDDAIADVAEQMFRRWDRLEHDPVRLRAYAHRSVMHAMYRTHRVPRALPLHDLADREHPTSPLVEPFDRLDEELRDALALLPARSQQLLFELAYDAGHGALTRAAARHGLTLRRTCKLRDRARERLQAAGVQGR